MAIITNTKKLKKDNDTKLQFISNIFSLLTIYQNRRGSLSPSHTQAHTHVVIVHTYTHYIHTTLYTTQFFLACWCSRALEKQPIHARRQLSEKSTTLCLIFTILVSFLLDKCTVCLKG